MLAKAEKLIADLGPALDKIPKHQRYRYGIRLEDALWELVRLIIEAAASGQKSKAQRLIADGVTDPVMPFRGQSNVTRLLTPEQMDAMTLAALAHIEGIYQRSWDRKDAIAAAFEADDREGIQAVVW